MTEVKPDNAAAIAFLKQWSETGPWVLTAIQTDRKSINTRTFYPATEPDLQAWLKEYNGIRNIYFHVNPPTRDLSKKAEREDIKSVDWFHVDIDPRAGEDLQSERERSLGLLTTKLPVGVPPPTVVVFSGGGYQGFWKLQEPIPINGDLALAEDAKRYNQQLEILFGADNCHNIDRIMRLPGTVNVPDERKRKKGRVPELATLLTFDPALVYPTSAFTPAAAVQVQGEKGFTSPTTPDQVKISGNVERLADINELDKWNVPDRVKIICVQGRHPDEPKAGDNSRSAWVFDAVCNLVRFGVPDEVIFSILTDPDFGISESMLEKGAGAEKYAIRQITNAKEEAIDPWLRKLNSEYAVIMNIGGKCRVVEEIEDATLKRSRLTIQSFDDFRNSYCNQRTQVGTDKQGLPVMMPVGKWWIEHPQRRQYKNVVFAPGHETKGSYNLWKGFSYPAKPGDCSLFLNHVKNNVCSGNEEWYNYLMGWMASAVQHPDSPGHVAVVLRGGKGVGKSFFAKVFGSLFGRHFLQVSNPGHLVGNFNAHLRDVVVLFADEAFYAGDKKHASILKTLITEETISIEAKGVDVEPAPNYVHLIMASNEEHVVPASGDERRFFVLDVGQAQQQNGAYFKGIADQLKSGGYEALLHHLRTYDLSGFVVQKVPQTEALKAQKDLSLSTEQDWWFNKLCDGTVFPSEDTWPMDVRKDALAEDYVEHTKRWSYSKKGNLTALGMYLKKVVPDLRVHQKLAKWDIPDGQGFFRQVERRAYFWVLPPLAECRARWEEVYGPQEWPKALDGVAPSGDIPF